MATRKTRRTKTITKTTRKAAPRRRKNEGEERIDVLCQCGWGRLGCPASELPTECPVCGFAFGEVTEAAENPEAARMLRYPSYCQTCAVATGLPLLSGFPGQPTHCDRCGYFGETAFVDLGERQPVSPPAGPWAARRNVGSCARCGQSELSCKCCGICQSYPCARTPRCQEPLYCGHCQSAPCRDLDECDLWQSTNWDLYKSGRAREGARPTRLLPPPPSSQRGGPDWEGMILEEQDECWESNPPARDLSKIRVLWRQSDTMSLWGIPYEMRTEVGQSPRDIVKAEWPSKRPWTHGKAPPEKSSGQVPSDWIWLGSPGWWGSMTPEEIAATEAFLASLPAGLIPEWPNEFVSIASWKNNPPASCQGCGRETMGRHGLCSACDSPRHRNPASAFRPGDRVKWKSSFLRSTGQYTGVPVDGIVQEGSGGMDPSRFVMVLWSDRTEPVLVNTANIMRAGRPDYSGNPGRALLPRSTRRWWAR